MPELLIDPEGLGGDKGGDKPADPPTDTPPTDTPPKDKLPDGYEGMSAAQIAQRAEDERIRREQAEDTAKRTNEAYLNAVINASQNQPKADTPPAPTLPDPEDDPEGHQRALLNQHIEESINKAVKPLAERFVAAESQTYAQATQTAKDRMLADPIAFPNAREYEADIDQYLAQFPANMQALPNARAEAYDRIDGVRRRQAAIDEHARASTAIETGAGRSSASRGDIDEEGNTNPSRLNDRERFSAERERMSPGMFREMQGPGTMDVDTFNRLKEAEAKGGRRAS
jgi:hypothetical protein